MKNTLLSPENIDRARRMTVVGALAAAVAASTACGGSENNETPPVTPDPVPTDPIVGPPPGSLVPPERAVTLQVETVSPQVPREIADLFKAVGEKVQNAYVSQASTFNLAHCTVRQEADGTYTLIVNSVASEPVEKADQCEVKATTDDDANLTVSVENFVDNQAPRVQNPNPTIRGYEENSVASVDVKKYLGTITDTSGKTIIFPSTGLPRGYTYDEKTNMLSWSYNAVAGIAKGIVVDDLKNATPININVALAPAYVPPVVTPTPPAPAPAPACPPGTYPTPGGFCA